MDQIKPELDLLIKELETERRSLKRMIKAAISEGDHLIVYYHSEALNLLNSRLNVLYNLRDPLYLQKQDLERRIKFINNMDFIKPLKKQKQWMKDWLEKQTTELKAELKTISEKTTQKN